MWERVKHLATVATFTLLIWFAADQNVEDDRTVDVTIRAVSADPARYVNLDAPGGLVTLRLTVEGLRRHLEAFDDVLARHPVLDAQIDDSKPVGQPQVLSARELLRAVREVEESSLRIADVTPSDVRVWIDDYVVIQDVAVLPEFGDLQVSNPVCSPSRVTVKLPRFAAGTLLASRTLKPSAGGLLRNQVDPSGADRSFSGPLPLSYEPEFQVPVEINPPAVQLSCVVESPTDRRRIGPVVVLFLVPNEVQRSVIIQSSPGSKFNLDIEVTGPRSQVQQLDLRQVRAYVEIRAQDLETIDQEITRTVEFVLPPGIKPVSRSSPPTVSFTLKRIEEPPDGP